MGAVVGREEFSIPRVDDRLLRPRLVSLLRERFDRRLVTVTAPAGYGKTTALAQALEQNALDSLGLDVWLPLTELTEPNSLFGRIVATLTGDVVGESAATDTTLDQVLDAVLAQAPQEVALVFDDVHFVSDEVVCSIDTLIEKLPANGHVVVGSRTRTSVRDARLISLGAVLQVDADELAFSAEEVQAICRAHGVSEVAHLGDEARWPAQLALGLQADRETQAQYLAEELLATMPADRRDNLAQLAVLVAADDALASRVTGTAIRSVEALVAGLPLVDRFENGTVRLHDLWVEALHPYISDERRATLRAEAARALVDDARFVDAMRMAFDARDFVLFEQAAKHQVRRPQTELTLTEVRQCIDMLAHTNLRSLMQYFEIIESWCLHGPVGLDRRFLAVADAAVAEGDRGLEAWLLYRAMQMLADQTRDGRSLAQRVEDLPDDGDPDVAMTKWFLKMITAMHDGDVDHALALLKDLYEIAGPMTIHYHAMFYSDLGRPELVTGDVFRDDWGVSRALTGAIELFVAQATWLRGVVTPELALELGADMAARTHKREVRPQLLAQLAVFTMVAAGAGDDDYIEELLEQIARLDTAAMGPNVATFAHIAPGVAAAAAGDEKSATAHLEQALELSGLDPWPYRSWFYALVPAYVLLPENREHLAALNVGPTLRTVLEIGAAIVAVREENNLKPLANVPWTESNLLRVHVPAAMLVELCVAGEVANVAEARGLLDEIPHAGTHLRNMAERYRGKISSTATSLAKQFPIPPNEPITVTLCGSVQLRRDGQLVEDSRWRRARVQELLTFLLLNPRVSRSAAAASIWPDLDDDAAMNNLRVHLSYLSKVLEPDRERGVPAWFVRSQGDALVLAPGAIDSDIHQMIRASNEAAASDQAGIPAQAIAGYRSVTELYRGELLEGNTAAWLDIDRLDIRSRAVTAHVRLGELALATGEPEQARDAARKAMAIEPSSQRSARLFVRALRGIGDHAGAKTLADAFEARLREDGLPLEPATTQIFHR